MRAGRAGGSIDKPSPQLPLAASVGADDVAGARMSSPVRCANTGSGGITPVYLSAP